MCVGGSFFKKVLPLAAIAATAYFTGGGSLAGMFGSGAADAGLGAGATLGADLASSSVAPSILGELTGGTSLATGLSSGLSSSSLLGELTAPTLGSMLTNGFGSALNFVKSNPYMVGQGLNLAGVGSQYLANNQRYDDYNKALKANQAANGALINQANGINTQSLNNFSMDNQNHLTDNAYEKRLTAAEQAYSSPNSIYLPLADSAPKEVKEANARKISDILDLGRDQIAAGAKLNSYGDVDLGNSLNLAESGRQLGTLQDFENGNNNVLQTSVQSAFTKPRTAQTIGDVLQGAGAIANAYASTRPKPKVKF